MSQQHKNYAYETVQVHMKIKATSLKSKPQCLWEPFIQQVVS